MKILITGGAGFLGQRLCQALLAHPDAALKPDTIILLDAREEAPGISTLDAVSYWCGDLSGKDTLTRITRHAPDVVFHLAAVVSGQAERDFDIGMRVNFHGTLGLLEALRAAGNNPRLVFSSSVAVYGPAGGQVTTDLTPPSPRNSYGAQKAACELIIEDYRRRQLVDGLSVRLPTVVVRPGAPNAAASSFASGIIREPLAGETAICPVAPEMKLWICSPDTAVANLVHAMMLPADAVGESGAIALPGITVRVADMISALERLGPPDVVSRIHMRRDPFIESIVGAWPADFDLERAPAMGFQRDRDIDRVIQQYIESQNPPA